MVLIQCVAGYHDWMSVAVSLRRWAPQWRTATDPETGVTARQLTNYEGHKHDFSFTNPGRQERA